MYNGEKNSTQIGNESGDRTAFFLSLISLRVFLREHLPLFNSFSYNMINICNWFSCHFFFLNKRTRIPRGHPFKSNWLLQSQEEKIKSMNEQKFLDSLNWQNCLSLDIEVAYSECCVSTPLATVKINKALGGLKEHLECT